MSDPIRVLMVSHYFDSHSGGIELVTGQMYERLAGPKCRITWAAAAVSQPPSIGSHQAVMPIRAWNGVEETIGIPFPVPSLEGLKRLKGAVRQSDIILLHDALYLSNIAAFCFARRRHIPIVIVQHIGSVPYKNPIPRYLMAAANAFVARPMLAKAQQVVFISRLTQRFFERLNFSAPPRVIFNGVDTGIFHPLLPDEDRAESRERFGLSRNGTIALFVGRFVEKKGMRVFKSLVELDSTVTWAFAGSGPMDPSTWDAKNVKVFAGLRGERLADLYRTCDLFVLPSIGEGLPLVLQEALACGLPVVCGADTAKADEDFGQSVIGVEVRAKDDEGTARDFIAAIRKVLAGQAARETAAERFESVNGRYSWNRNTEAYLEILEQLRTGPQPLEKNECLP